MIAEIIRESTDNNTTISKTRKRLPPWITMSAPDDFSMEQLQKSIENDSLVKEAFLQVFASNIVSMRIFFRRLTASIVVIFPHHTAFTNAFDRTLEKILSSQELLASEHGSAIAARQFQASAIETCNVPRYNIPTKKRSLQDRSKRKAFAAQQHPEPTLNTITTKPPPVNPCLRVQRIDQLGNHLPVCEYSREHTIRIVCALLISQEIRGLKGIYELPEQLVSALLYGITNSNCPTRVWLYSKLLGNGALRCSDSLFEQQQKQPAAAFVSQVFYEEESLVTQCYSLLRGVEHENKKRKKNPVDLSTTMAVPANTDLRERVKELAVAQLGELPEPEEGLSPSRLLMTCWMYLTYRLSDLRLPNNGDIEPYFRLLISMLQNETLFTTTAAGSIPTEKQLLSNGGSVHDKWEHAVMCCGNLLTGRIVTTQIAIERTAQVFEEIALLIQEKTQGSHFAKMKNQFSKVVFESYYMPLTVEEVGLFHENVSATKEQFRTLLIREDWTKIQDQSGSAYITASRTILNQIYRSTLHMEEFLYIGSTVRERIYGIAIDEGATEQERQRQETNEKESIKRGEDVKKFFGKRWTVAKILPPSVLLQELMKQMCFTEARLLVRMCFEQKDLWTHSEAIAVQVSEWARPEYLEQHMKQLQLRHPFFRTRVYTGIDSDKQAPLPESVQHRMSVLKHHPLDVFYRHTTKESRDYIFDHAIEYYCHFQLMDGRNFIIMSARLHELLRNLDLVEMAADYHIEKPMPFYKLLVRQIMCRQKFTVPTNTGEYVSIDENPLHLRSEHQGADSTLSLYAAVSVISTWVDLNKRESTRLLKQQKKVQFCTDPRHDYFNAYYELLPCVMKKLVRCGLEITDSSSSVQIATVVGVLKNFISARYVHSLPIPIARRLLVKLSELISLYKKAYEYFNNQRVHFTCNTEEELRPKKPSRKENPLIYDKKRYEEVETAYYEAGPVWYYLSEKLKWLDECISQGLISKDIPRLAFDVVGTEMWTHEMDIHKHKDGLVAINRSIYILIISGILDIDTMKELLLNYELYNPTSEEDLCYEALAKRYSATTESLDDPETVALATILSSDRIKNSKKNKQRQKKKVSGAEPAAAKQYYRSLFHNFLNKRAAESITSSRGNGDSESLTPSNASSTASSMFFRWSRNNGIRRIYRGVNLASRLASFDSHYLQAHGSDPVPPGTMPPRAFLYEIKPHYCGYANGTFPDEWIGVEECANMLRAIEWRTYAQRFAGGNGGGGGGSSNGDRKKPNSQLNLESLRQMPLSTGEDSSEDGHVEEEDNEIVLEAASSSCSVQNESDEDDSLTLENLESLRDGSSSVTANPLPGQHLHICKWPKFSISEWKSTEGMNAQIPIHVQVNEIKLARTESNENIEHFTVEYFDTSFRLPVPSHIEQLSRGAVFNVDTTAGSIPAVSFSCKGDELLTSLHGTLYTLDPTMHETRMARMLRLMIGRFDIERVVDHVTSASFLQWCTLDEYRPRQNSMLYEQLMKLAKSAYQHQQQVPPLQIATDEQRLMLFTKYRLERTIKIHSTSIEEQQNSNAANAAALAACRNSKGARLEHERDMLQLISSIHGSNFPVIP